MSEKLATVAGPSENIRELIEQTTMARKGDYEKAYIEIEDGYLAVISTVAGSKAMSFSPFYEGEMLTTIDVHEAAGDSVGVLMDIDTFLSYYELVEEDGEHVRLEFHGEPDKDLAKTVQMYGDFDAGLTLLDSNSILESMPLWIPERFDNDEGLWKTDVITLDTEIQTTVSTVDKIIKAIDADTISKSRNFPIVVEDGEFKLDVSHSTSGGWVSGLLSNDETEVNGADVGNLYGEGFKHIFNTLETSKLQRGDECPVTLYTAPSDRVERDGTPLVVEREYDSGIVRHIIAPSGSL